MVYSKSSYFHQNERFHRALSIWRKIVISKIYVFLSLYIEALNSVYFGCAQLRVSLIFNDISWYFPFCYSEYFKDYIELLPAWEKDLQNSSRYCQIRSDANLEKIDNFCAKTRFKSLSEKPANQIMVVVGSKWGSILKNVDIWLYSFCFVFWRIVKKSLLKRDLTKTWIKNVEVKIYCWILTHYTEIYK